VSCDPSRADERYESERDANAPARAARATTTSERANRLTARTFGRLQVYEKRGDVYFLSDKKQATANVKTAVARAKENR